MHVTAAGTEPLHTPVRLFCQVTPFPTPWQGQGASAGSIGSPCTVSTQNQEAEFWHGGEGGSTALTPVPWQAGTGGLASGDVSPGGNSCTPRTSARPQVRTERSGSRRSASTPGQASVPLVSVRGGPCWCAKPLQWHGRGGEPGEVSRARGGELCEQRLPPRGGCKGGSLLSFSFYEKFFLFNKSRGECTASGVFLGGRWHCCGAHGCVPAGMRLCAPALRWPWTLPSLHAGVPAGLSGEDPPGSVPPKFCTSKCTMLNPRGTELWKSMGTFWPWGGAGHFGDLPCFFLTQQISFSTLWAGRWVVGC